MTNSKESISTRGLFFGYEEDKSDRFSFTNNFALVIGIDGYDHQNGITPLKTATSDAQRLADILEEQYQYEVDLLTADVTRNRLVDILDALPTKVGEDDRLIFYFAGHGVALDGDDGPAGYLLPQDANAQDRNTFLPMQAVHDVLDMLTCRHCLIILDCCFSGAFRWSSKRSLIAPPDDILYRERYERFIRFDAWQVLTSAGHDQKALDSLKGATLGSRLDTGRGHSPFAEALFAALEGKADANGDGVLVATELYLYLRDQVEVRAEREAQHQQTPSLWPLNRHDKGEFIFLLPHADPSQLKPAPEPDESLNPYRGLQSYNERDAHLFFGRQLLIQKLAKTVTSQPLTVMLGVSGTGKSSLVKAGLLPYLRNPEAEHRDQSNQRETDIQNPQSQWSILLLPAEGDKLPQPLRPTAEPLQELHRLLTTLPIEPPSLANLRQDPLALNQAIDRWQSEQPDQTILLVIDQFEELITLCRVDVERQQFLRLLIEALIAHPRHFRLILTLRSDFEPQIQALLEQIAEFNSLIVNTGFDENVVPKREEAKKENQLFDIVNPKSTIELTRFIVPPMSQAELREVIEGPAGVAVLHFDPPGLVDKLINEVIQTPGALPLLSFTLSELYICYLNRYRRGETEDRAMLEADYNELGGVIGSLRNRATEEHNKLDNAHQETMRRIMLRMIAMEGGELARRRVPRSELIYPDEKENNRIETVLTQLINERLVVSGEIDGEGYVEPAHDALIRAWDKLLTWSRDAEEYLPLQRRLTQAAMDWDQAAGPKKKDLLWHNNPRLPQLQQILEESSGQNRRGFVSRSWRLMFRSIEIFEGQTWLNLRETEFVRESIIQRSKDIRRLIGTVSGVIITLSVLVILALFLWRQSENNLAEAQWQTRLSRSGELAAQSRIATLDESPQLGLLLAIEALSTTLVTDETHIPEAEQALRDALHSMSGVGLRGHQTAPLDAARSVGPDMISTVRVMAISDDSQWLATGGTDGRIQVWDLTDVKANPLILEGHNDRVESLVFSSDHRWLITSGNDKTIRLWDMLALLRASHQVIHNDERVSNLEITPDQKWLIGREQPGDTFVLWPLYQPNERPIRLSPPGARIVTTVVSADSRWLIGVGDDQRIYVWELIAPTAPPIIPAVDGWKEGSLTNTEERHWLTYVFDNKIHLWDLNDLAAEPIILEGNNRPYAMSHDGTLLAATAEDGNINLWDMTNLEKEPIVFRGQTEVNRILVNPDKQWLITGSRDNRIRIWSFDDRSRTPIVLTGYENPLQSLVVSADSRLLAAASSDTTIRLWDLYNLNTETSAAFINFATDDHMEISADRQTLVTRNNQGTVRVWDFANLAALPEVYALDDESIERATVSPDRRWLVTAHAIPDSFDETIKLWFLTSPGRPPIALEGQIGQVSTLRISLDSRWLVTSDGEFFVERFHPEPVARLWDLTDPTEPPTKLEGHESIIFDTALSPNNQWVATASSDGTVRVWSLSDFGKDPIVFDNEGSVTKLEFSPNSRWLAVGDGDPRGSTGTEETNVRLWDLTQPTAAPITLAGLRGSEITAIEFSPDQHWLAASSASNLARVWDMNDLSKAPVILEGHDVQITSITIGPNSRWLAIASVDETVRLWNLHDLAAPSVLLPVQPGDVRNLAISPDGRWLVTGGNWGSYRLWYLDMTEAIEMACRTVGRNLAYSEWVPRFTEPPYHRTCQNLPLHPSFIGEGRVLAGRGEFEAAREVYDLALELDPTLEIEPDVEFASFLRSEGYQAARYQGDEEKARMLFQQAIEYNPALDIDRDTEIQELMNLHTADQLRSQATKLAEAGKVAEATELLAKAVELNPFFTFDPEAEAQKYANKTIAAELSEQASALAYAGNAQEAMAKYKEAVDLDPTVIGTNPRQVVINHLVSTADNAYKTEDYPKAIEFYTKATELGAKTVDIYFNLAQAYQKQQMFEPAVTNYSELLELNPGYTRAYTNRGWIYTQLKRYSLALADYTKAIELNPNYAWTYYSRAGILASQEDFTLAIADLNQAIQLDFQPREDAYTARARAYFAVGQDTDAVTDFRRAVTLDPDNAVRHNRLCWYGSLAGYVAEVMGSCNRVVELEPEHGGYRDSRGLARALTGDYVGASDDFEFFVNWLQENDRYEEGGQKRETWIKMLSEGKNPFSTTVLRDLRQN